MFDSLMNTAKTFGRKVNDKTVALAATAASLVTVGAASASTASTTVITPTFSGYDVINSIANQIYPAIIPILTTGAIVWGAWWIFHKVRGVVS